VASKVLVSITFFVIITCLLLCFICFGIEALQDILPHLLCGMPAIVGTLAGIYGVEHGNRRLKIVSFFLLIACYFFAVIGWFAGTDIYRWVQLEKNEHKFTRVQHPAGTTFIERERGTPAWGAAESTARSEMSFNGRLENSNETVYIIYFAHIGSAYYDYRCH
jgi:hypothetical protein